MATKPIRVLITCINGTMAPAAVHLLRAQARFPIAIFGADAADAGAAAALLDGFRAVPSGDAPEYVPALIQIAARDKIDVIVPWSDPEAFALARRRADLRAVGTEILVSPPERLDLIRNKLETYRQLTAAGIPVPEYTCVSHMADLRAALAAYGYPHRTVIVKPTTGRGGRGLNVLCGLDQPPAWLGTGERERRVGDTPDEEQLAAMLQGETLVMPALGLPAYDVDVLAKAGQPRAAVVRRRNNPTGIPFEGNYVMADPRAQRYCLDVAAALGLDSLHDIDLMTDPNGELRLLEVNPRPSGSLAASLAAGVPILDAAIAQALGQELPVPLPLRDMEVVRIPMALVAFGAPLE